MDILVCPDKFKGSLSALQVSEAIRAGVLRHSPASNVLCHPMSDGGDGMLDILIENIGLTSITRTVNDPLFRPVNAAYGISRAGDAAYIEMSKASGLVLVEKDSRNPLETTTLGTGELMLDALRRGVKRIVLGIGGSATNDAGLGVAVALGYRFLDKNGGELAPAGKSLQLIESIDDQSLVPELAGTEIIVASDVQNPFYGNDGAAHVFARQKGADDESVAFLDKGLRSFARLIRERTGVDLQQIAGSGAAGGLGGGAVALLGARLESGIEMMIKVTRLEEKLADVDWVITGEGMLDEQTLAGKVIDGVIRAARKYHKRVAVLCGSSALSPRQLTEFGIDYCDTVLKDGRSLHDAMSNGYQYLEEAAFSFMAAAGHKERDAR